MTTMNLVTYCDDKYAKYLLPQLVNVSSIQQNNKIVFYLLHSRVSKGSLDLLRKCANKLPNLEFKDISITDNLDKYNEIAKGGTIANENGKLYPYEVLFLADIHKHLPDNIDRIFYIQTGDVFLSEDISEYYYSEFNDKVLTVELTNRLYYKTKDSYYGSADKKEFILKHKNNTAIFNSGNMLINLQKMRENDYSLEYFLNIFNLFKTLLPDEAIKYQGDQAFFSVAFLGEINSLHGLNSFDDVGYRPYNASPVAEKTRYKLGLGKITNPKIIHFDTKVKPWQLSPTFFDSGIPSRITTKNALSGKSNFLPIIYKNYYINYWKYVKQTPIYDELLYAAEIYSKSLKQNYLPAVHAGVWLRYEVERLRAQQEDTLERVKKAINILE